MPTSRLAHRVWHATAAGPLRRRGCSSSGDAPDPSHGQVSVGAAGGRAGAGVVDVGHQRVGRRADHRLQVDAGVRQRRDGQRPLPAEPGRQARAGEARHWTQGDSCDLVSIVAIRIITVVLRAIQTN